MLPSLRRGAFARARTAAVVAVAALAAVLPAGVAHADALPNDDFDGSAVVTALPFTAHQDTSRATKAPDDPSWCQYYDAEGSVWFSYTPTEDVILRATTAGSDHPTILSAYSGLRGSLRGASRACDTGQPSTGASVTFRATAGTTYHLMVAGYDVAGGDLSFGLTTVAAAPNDRFADAEAVTGLPATRTPDLSTAWYEQDEPDSGCTDQAGPSVWYSFTPTTTTSAVVGLDHSNVTATVYTGDTRLHDEPVGPAGVPGDRGHDLPDPRRRVARPLGHRGGELDRGAAARPVRRRLAVGPDDLRGGRLHRRHVGPVPRARRER